MATIKLWVKDLRHEDEARIADAVRGLEGVFFAILNHEDQCAEVDFEDDLVTCAEIRSKIAEFGYEVRNAG